MLAKAFKEAQKFVENYKNSEELYTEARAEALTTLLILPFEGNNVLANYIRNQFMIIQSNESKEFLQIISRDQVNHILNEQKFQLSGMVKNDQLVEIGEFNAANQILSATLTTTHRPSETIKTENIKQEKNIIIRKEKYIDDDGVEKINKIKDDVYATVKYFKKSSEAALVLTFQIIDLNSGLTIYSDNIKTKAVFFHDWATYDGDKRALSRNYSQLVKKKEKFAPSESELSMKAAEKLSNKLMKKISAYYSN